MPEQHFPLHPSQQDVYMDQLLNIDSPGYNIGGYIILKGELDKEKFHEAVSSAAAVFDAFKMRFDLEAQDLLCHYDDDFSSADLTELDLSEGDDPTGAAKAWVQERFNKSFRLTKEALPFEQYLIKVTEGEHWFFGKYHHLITDGYGFIVYVQYVAGKYAALVSGNEFSLSYPSYKDAAINADTYYHSEEYKQDGDYWKEKIPAKPENLLSRRYNPISGSGKTGATYNLNLTEEQRGLLDEIQVASKAGLLQLTMAALLIYFGKITGFSEFIFGTPIHKRGSRQLRNTLGTFTGMLPVTATYKKEQTLADLIKEIATTQRSDYRHQNYLIGDLNRDLKINSIDEFLCEVLVNYEPLNFELNFGDTITANIIRLANEDERSPVELCWRDYGKNQPMQLEVQFRFAYFNEQEVASLAERILHIIGQFPGMLDRSVDEINILIAAEERQLLIDFNDTAREYPKNKSLVDLFEEQAMKTPESIAVVFEEGQLSYKELNERSNQLAHYLKRQGVKAEMLVPICLERSMEMIIGILGVLKAGGAYVPIDPEYPEDRISYMLEDTGAVLVLTSKGSRGKLRENDIFVIDLDEERELISREPAVNLDVKVSPEQLAYVIYTSGSTGKPKGVMIEHGGVVNLGVDQAHSLRLKHGMRILQFASFGFDASCNEIFSTFLNGGCLVMCTKEVLLSARGFKDLVDKHHVEVAILPPSFQQVVEHTLSSLKTIKSAGEPLNETIGKYLQSQGVRLINGYGPTEATVCATLSDDPIKPNHVITIGKPISNKQVYILSPDNQLSPIGITGEIYIGGAGLARGYLNRPELTAEKFISDPFSKETGARLYRTGDLGRWLPEGDLEYLGRIDDQVKIRGYRIELGEIESVLNAYEQVIQAVVVAREDSSGNKRLIGYVVAAGEFDKQKIQDYLSTQLPDYMVPSHLVELQSMPLTANGKIDRKALPDPEGTQQEGGYTAPRNETEAKLAEIWQDILELDQVGINDDFFGIGGHSLLAVRLVSQVRKSFGMELPINDVFDYPTVGQLAARIAEEPAGELLPAVTAAARPEYIPLSFSQERLWFIDRLEGSAQYNHPAVLRLKGELNREILEKTLRAIIGRHEVLRTVIKEHEGQGYQQVMSAAGWAVGITEGLSYKEGTTGLSEYIAGLISRPFDLSADYLLRADLIKEGEEDHILVVTMHHIASDGWSRAVLVKEVVELYKGYAENAAPALPLLPVQYADYAIWQRKYMQGEVLEAKLGYWKSKLEDVATLELPADYSRPAIQRLRGAICTFSIDKGLTSQVQALGHQHGATLYMTLLAAFKVLLYRYSGQEDICVGTTVAGRNQQELEGLIGFFINTLALRSQVKGDSSFIGLLEAVKNTTLEAYGHQEVPFEKVVDAVVKGRDMSRNPLFQVLFSLGNTPEIPELKFGGLSLGEESQEHVTSRFDIAFMVRETSTGIHGIIEYNTDLYNAERIARMAAHFRELLQSVVLEPQTTVGKLAILSQEEKNALKTFGISESSYPKEATVADLFEAHALHTPDAIAIVYEEQQLSYRSLNERSNQLAHYLRSKGVKEDTLVPLLIERGVDMLIGILGILKAGGAYVPIDTDFPQDRVSYMLEDTGAQVVISSSTSSYKLPAGMALEVIGLDQERATLRKQPSNRPSTHLKPGNLAYVIYTSGSTGKPKGVQISHRNLIDYVFGLDARTGISACKSFALVSSIATDLGNTVLYGSLLSGGTLHLFPKETVSHIEALHAYFEAHKIDCLKIVPSHWKALSMDGQPLLPVKLLIFGGEALQSSVADMIRMTETSCRIVNHYGPTETTIGKLLHEVKADKQYGRFIPIGKPFSNTKTCVLSKELSQCPIGIPGQLYISGEGVAKGYLNRPELTAEKFISDPYGEPGEKMYATGDRVVYQEDGNIIFIGRADDQVKIRGYRVEPGEITRILEQSEHVSQAVVLAREDKQGNMQLVGYIVAQGAYDKAGIQAYLKAQLPDYMVPSHLVELQSMPLTANGKIDRKALPDPEGTAEGGYAAPRNETEAKLAEIWQDILELDQVGINDDFFGIGGHSLLAVRLVSQVRKAFGMELPISDIFDYPTVGQLAARIAEEPAGELLPAVTAAARPEYIPLSFSQERLWFIDRLEGSAQYNQPAVLRLKGELNREILEKTLRAIIGRHEVLRTVIKEHEGQGYQQVMSAAGWAVGITEGLSYKEGTTGLSEYIAGLISRPFDLSADYLLRADLIKEGEEDHILVVTMHHIASDGWSRAVLVKEVVELYKGYAENAAPALPLLPVQYADYAIWQRKYMQGEVLEAKLGYWKSKLEDVATLELPADYSRPAIQRLRGAICTFSIDKGLTSQVQALGHQHGATLYMTLLAAFKVLLYRYSGQEDICVGTTVAGRNQQELEGLIGFFINTLALRSQVKGDSSFIGLLEAVKNTTLEAYGHQEVPFEKVVDAVVKGRDMSRNPLFQVLFSLGNTPEIPELKFGGLSLGEESQEHVTSRFDIAFMVRETSTGIHGIIEYNTDLYNAERIARMAAHFRELLQSVVLEPQTTVGKLAILSQEEKNALKTFGISESSYPKEATVADLFEAHALHTPDAIAIVYEEQQLSYRSLNERSNQLAHYLRSKGVKEDTLVPLLIERGVDMLIGILGILKAGGAYVPIDTDFPQDRVSYMLEDTGAQVVISSSTSSYKLPDGMALEVIGLDQERATLRKQPSNRPSTHLQPGNLAYVIYTSGSTGKPKGVQISHRNLIDYVFGLDARTGISACKSFALVSSIATDLGNTVLYGSLLSGGTLHVFPKETVSHIEALHAYFEAHKIDCLKIVPSHWKALSMDGQPLLPVKLLIFGGEALQSSVADMIRMTETSCRIVNHYGPTETTIGKLLHEVKADKQYGRFIPIGKPFSNTKTCVLSKELSQCPIGIPGQLYISGEGVAKGYLNRPELTAEKFISDPYGEPGEKMYATGDRVVYQEDGNIIFIGRADDQVKIRGYRVEPGEITRILEQSEHISQAVVLAREDKQGNMQLVGYVVPEGTFDKQAIQGYLHTKLPDYMVPAHLVELQSMPLTANGKIDRKALPDPEGTQQEGGYTAPRNETEAKLAAIWQDILELDQVGINDDFFGIGGHSLLAVRLVSQVRKAFGMELPISDIFDYPTVGQLAARIAEEPAGELLPAVTAAARPEYIPLSFSQERLWFIDRLEGSTQYNQPAVLRLKGELNREILEKTLRAIIKRHEVLRTIILEDDGRGYQHVMSSDNWSLGIVAEIVRGEAALSEYVLELISKPFDLSADYMLRADLIKESEEDHILVVTMHHIASDGWSRAVLVKEVVELYKGYAENAAPALPLLPVQYADYAIWQRKYMQGEVLEAKLGYWKSKLEDVATLELPADYSRPAIQRLRGAICTFSIDKGLTSQVQALGHQHGATLYMTLLAAFKVLLYRYSGQEDICVGTPVAGRNQQELEGLIGFFINTLALRSRVTGDKPFIEMLQEIKGTTLEAYAHQEVPFEKVVDAVVKSRDMGRSPLFQVLFSLQNTPDIPELKFGGLSLTSEIQERATSKFDLSFMLNETSTGIQGAVEYNTDLYREGTIGGMIGHYMNLLEAIMAAPEAPIGRLNMLGAPEEEQLLREFNDTVLAYPKDKSVAELFEEQVAKTPDAIAVIFEDGELTYRELNERSNQLAHYLQKQGVKAETYVPICLERSLEMIIGILGILKAGGAYVPIDPEYPQDRINYMLEDTGAELIISSKASGGKLNGATAAQVIMLDEDWQQIEREKKNNPQIVIHPEQLAYVIYTSGSTGRPKGVMIENRSANAFIAWCQTEFAHNQFDIVYATTSICFDLSVYELFYPLSIGKQIRILENGLAISKYLAKDANILINTVPSVIDSLINEKADLSHVRVINMAGEPIPQRILEALDTSHTSVRNLYGPTEDTTYSTICRLENGKPINIGKPIANTRIYILNGDKALSPIAVPGEICIGGDGLARGYLNKPELTTEKFITDPFSKAPNARLYKTGDLGRWLPDGNIEYLGRKDDQVKIRGYRIELGEIESVLEQSGLVKQAIVLAKEDKKGTKRLVGYVVPEGTFDKQAIQGYLHTKLPDYMVPGLWVELESIPLTPNGKLDRKALPDPDMTAQPAGYTAPRNETEADLAQTWQELLGVEQIGIYDNFFELGGDSILTIQVVSRMRRLGYVLQPKDIFNHQEIAGLSAVTSREGEQEELGEQGLLSGAFGLLPIQSWYLEKAPAAVSHFNQSVLLKIDKSVTAEALQAALEQLLAQHDALRLSFEEKEGVWQQAYGTANVELYREDLRGYPQDNLAGQVTAIADKYQGRLSIGEGQLVRMVWMQTPETEAANRLLIVIHHLAVDGVSWRILLDDLEQLLSGAMEGQQVSLGNKSSSYRQWHAAMLKYSGSQKLQVQKAYWVQVAGSYQALPEDKAYSGEVLVKDMHHYQVKLGAEQTRALLQEVPKVYHTEINDLLLSALSSSLCSWSGTDQVVIGLEGHGREEIVQEIDSSRTVGWFTGLYPVQLKAGINTDTLIKGVKEGLRGIPDKGIGYGVLKYIEKAEALQVNDPWDLVFNYLGQLDTAVSSGRWLTGAEESKGSGVSEEQVSFSRLIVNSQISGGELVLNWSYSSMHYNQETIIKLGGEYISRLAQLIAHCVEQGKTGSVYTPSDYGLSAEVTYQELDRFMEEPYRNYKRKHHVENIYRLSGLQQGMLFHGLYDEGAGGGYIEQFGCDLIGANLELLMDSWSVVIRHHSILRSAFYYDSFSVPVQCVYREITLPVEELDYRGMDEASMTLALQEYEAADRAIGFDFKSAPLMRLCLIRLEENRYRMLWTYHHIVFDGWSMPVLMEEFLDTYDLLVSEQDVPEASEDCYEDYIRYLEHRDKASEEQYWRGYLEGISHGTLLPFIRKTAERTKGGGEYGSLSLRLDSSATARLQSYAQSHRLTVSSLIQGIWALLLHKYTGDQEVLYGVVVSGRPDELPDVEQRVGMYINTLTFKAAFGQGQEIGSWLQGLQADQVSSRQYQYSALVDVQGWTGIKGDLFDSLLVFENYPVSKLISSKSWSLQVENVAVKEQTNYPMSIIVGGTEELSIKFNYNTELIEQEYVKAIRDQFEYVLQQVTDGQADTINDIRVLTAPQEEQLLIAFNETAAAYPKDKSVITLFEEQVVKSPEAIAVIFEEEHLSYKELNERSNQLAHYLQKQGVKAETLVPICLERSLEMIVGILGTLKAGGAYLPIDPEYPEERIGFMLEDARASIVLTSKAAREKLKVTKPASVIELDGDWEQIGKEKNINLEEVIQPEQLAYVIYTSGSTGRPKGVMIGHMNVVSLVKGVDYVVLDNEDTLLVTGSPSFDATTFEYWGMLLNGGRLILCSTEALLDSESLKANISKHEVSLMWFTSSWFNQLVDSNPEVFAGLRTILVGGEKLSEYHIEKVRKQYPELKLINGYGPTENTTFSLTYPISVNVLRNPIPIGRPLNNRKAYVLTEFSQLSPIGVSGEICLGGAGLARGYLNLPELTKEKFIWDPFSKEEGSRLYKTGDLGRWLPDGNIEYMGRMDDQVKIRGYRIEPGEIESVLNGSGLVQQGVVLARQDNSGNKRLVGYIVPEGAYDKQSIHDYLSAKLPDYMVPVIWVLLDSMPLTQNGKIDRKALPDPEMADMNATYVAPRNETEIKLAKIWQELLGLERIGIYDSFFELGGHSLLAMRVVSCIQRDLLVSIPIKILFRFTSISDLSKYIEIETGNKSSEIKTDIYKVLDV